MRNVRVTRPLSLARRERLRLQAADRSPAADGITENRARPEGHRRVGAAVAQGWRDGRC